MQVPTFIAGDWGTSHLRLSLCDGTGAVIETKTGPGVSAIKQNIADVFQSLIEGWDQHCKLPAILCGMVGSTIGWREVRYLPCPAKPETIAGSVMRFETRGRAITIVPGLSCRNRLSAPDVMRGEETQILGAMHLEPELAKGRHVLCMPGTHTKWVTLNDGIIEDFLTAVSGEMYDLVYRHSVLVRNTEASDAIGGPIFQRAVEKTRRYPNSELIHLLFEVRSGQLSGELRGYEASDYLSGLVIGQDVSGAHRLFRDDISDAQEVVVISNPRLGKLYSHALSAHGIKARRIDGDVASLAGLSKLHKILEDNSHAA